MNHRTTALVLALAFTTLALPARAQETKAAEVLGTTCVLRIYRGASDAAFEAAFARLRQLEAELTVNRAGSQIDAVNAAAGRHPVRVGPDAMAIIKRGLEYASQTDGAFDQTVGPLVKLWDILGDHPHVPSDADRKAAMRMINWKDVVVDDRAQTVYLKRRGMGLDLGSASKGYAADQVARLLEAKGVTSAIIDLGGNILTIGSKPDGTPFKIGLQNPDEQRNTYVGIFKVSGRTVVTSGVYERFFIENGKRYHHILDTRTGFPVDNGLTSVTVITEKSFDADGLTTAIFALGREKGMALARRRGVDVVLIDDHHRLYMDPAVAAYFQLTDTNFSIAK